MWVIYSCKILNWKINIIFDLHCIVLQYLPLKLIMFRWELCIGRSFVSSSSSESGSSYSVSVGGLCVNSVFPRVAAHFWHIGIMISLLFKYLFFFYWTPQKSSWRYPPQPWVHLRLACTVRVPNLHISSYAHLNNGLSPVRGDLTW